jgi:hypothetical protein
MTSKAYGLECRLHRSTADTVLVRNLQGTGSCSPVGARGALGTPGIAFGQGSWVNAVRVAANLKLTNSMRAALGLAILVVLLSAASSASATDRIYRSNFDGP